jgi:hypothetical protein
MLLILSERGITGFMIPSEEWLSPTRASGLLAYGTAVVCCAIAWRRSQVREKLREKPQAKAQRPASRLAAVLMFIDAVLLFDMAFNWRWMLHGLFGAIAQSHHEYDQRRGPQEIALVLLAGLLLTGLFAVLRTFRNRMGALLAVSGVWLSVISWCVEVVSLHAVDHVLYHPLGPCMVISLVWVLACTMTSVGVLADAQRFKTRRAVR